MTRASGTLDGFIFYLSCDINLQFRVRVDKLLGRLPAYLDCTPEDLVEGVRPSSLYVVGQLCAHGEVLGLPSRSRYAEAGLQDCTWGTWLAFPVKYRDLPQHAQLALTVWEVAEAKPLRVLGGATMRLFSKKGRLKTGPQKLRVWLGSKADAGWPPATPGKVPVKQRGEIGRLEQLQKRYSRGEIQHVDWLDHLTLRKIERVRQQEDQPTNGSPSLQLHIELPSFPHAVIYQQAQLGTQPNLGLTPEAPPNTRGSSLILVHDPEVGRSNPAELKAQKLARSGTRGLIDRDLKPDTEEKRRINAVLLYPPNRPLDSNDKALLWRFRFSLTQEKRALTKFLKCVDWSDLQEARQAAELMQQWVPIDIADALELLSPDFTNEEVRAHAVEVLQRTDDEELLYYLLQLVQALRYESSEASRLARFLIARAGRNPIMGIFLHWHLYTEWEDPTFGARAEYVHKMFQEAQSYGGPQGTLHNISLQMGMVAQLRHIVQELKAMRGNSAKKAERLREMVSEYGQCGELSQIRVPLPLDPAIMLAGIIPSDCAVFKSALAPLRLTFRTVGERSSSGSAEEPPLAGAASDAAASAERAVSGALAGSSRGGQGSYMVIYKKGDDLRQDQLVVQMFSLMDRLLKRENLDLRLTPYRVLPTSSDDGLIECVPSTALAKVLAEHRSIHRFLAERHPDPTGPFGLRPEVLSTFVKSCAGYCVMTYILGIGDRHLDNLMLCDDGRLFHIDFGFIMGRDPKPFPPPMKLCKEMVDAMGGAESDHYRQFRTYCCEAYNILRKSATLILSLFHLMAGASIPDVRYDPEKAMLKLQEKLRLDVDDEAAVEWMQQLLNESATALMPQIMETTHRWAQYWR
ncbi:hypothetical protein WJX72_006428 [[Myrmecia] bisecta]|uniref:phosphatidylinositol 3-kinase n=1 Tax=[Myrmecia] bisecta TaxID=41462 RepID=A0AAW1PNW7_9CHLO